MKLHLPPRPQQIHCTHSHAPTSLTSLTLYMSYLFCSKVLNLWPLDPARKTTLTAWPHFVCHCGWSCTETTNNWWSQYWCLQMTRADHHWECSYLYPLTAHPLVLVWSHCELFEVWVCVFIHCQCGAGGREDLSPGQPEGESGLMSVSQLDQAVYHPLGLNFRIHQIESWNLRISVMIYKSQW